MTFEPAIEPALPKRRRSSKAEPVFETCYPDADRQFRMIDKNQLIIPVDDYQRSEVDGRIATAIAMKFDSVAFGALTVIDSVNKQLLVADGGTRLSAVRKRADIRDVPCLVYSNLTREQEAETFLRINQERKKLTTPQLQHAEVFAGFDLALRVDESTNRMQAARIGFDSLRELRASWKAHPQSTSTVIELLEHSASDKHVSAKVFKGLVTLEQMLSKDGKTLNRKPIIAKLRTQFGTLDIALNAVSPTRYAADRRTLAKTLARQLKIRIPNPGDAK